MSESSRIAVTFEQPKSVNIASLATAVVGFNGTTERGPVNTPVEVNSWEDFRAKFGGPDTDSSLFLAVFLFFLNQGKRAVINRVTKVNGSGVTIGVVGTLDLLTNAVLASSATVVSGNAAPFTFAAADTLLISVDGAGNSTATFDAAAATIECASAETYVLSDAMTLTVKVDGGDAQTITFNTADFVNIAVATAEEVAAVINQDIVGASAIASTGGTEVTITSDKQGTDSEIEVTGGTANAALGFSTSAVSGTGDVADITSVTSAEMKTVIEADVAGVTVSADGSGYVTITRDTTGLTKTLQCASSNVATKADFDLTLHTGADAASASTLQVDGKTVGDYAANVQIGITAASSGIASEFNMIVYESSIAVETFPNLTMDDDGVRYVETIVNGSSGSNLIAVTDLDVSGTPTQQRPANIAASSALASGDDGLTGIADADYVGSSTYDTGFYAFDDFADLTILCCPEQATATVSAGLITYCEGTREGLVFGILDTPSGYTTDQTTTYVNTTASLLEASEICAVYWPWVRIANKWQSVYGTDKTITMSVVGGVAGSWSRLQASEGGVYKTPAGIDNGEIWGIEGFEGTENIYGPDTQHEVQKKGNRDKLVANRINPIRKDTGTGYYQDDSLCLTSTGNWPYIAQILGAQHITRSVSSGLEWVRHKRMPQNRDRAYMSVYQFMFGEMKKGAFASDDQDEAFFIDVSDALNTPTVFASGRFKVRIGLAFGTPSRFVDLLITKDTRALDAELGF